MALPRLVEPPPWAADQSALARASSDSIVMPALAATAGQLIDQYIDLELAVLVVGIQRSIDVEQQRLYRCRNPVRDHT